MAHTLGALARGFCTLSLTGICKNAGKTTALNALIGELREDRLGLTSVGRDGEETDEVSKTPKPRIYVKRGTLVATAERLLNKCDISKRIVYASGIHTPLGEVVAVEALSDGFVELAGPSTSAQTADIVQTLVMLGAKRVFIDGAISRRSFVRTAQATVLCAGASYSPDINETVAETAYFAQLLRLKTPEIPVRLPEAGEITLVGQTERTVARDALTDALLTEGDTHTAIFSGAVGEDAAKALLEHGALRVVAADAGRILLSRETYDRLIQNDCTFSVINPTTLVAVCANPYAVRGEGYDAGDFAQRLRRAVDVPVFDLKEVGA